MDLAEDALDAAETYVKPRIYDDKGQTIAIRYTRILVPPALVSTAQRLMQTDRKVGSADWDINIYKGRYDLVEMPYYNSSGTAHWILYDPNVGSEGLQFLWSQPVKLEGPELVFDKLLSLLRETVVEKFLKFREILINVFGYERTLSEAL